VNGGAELAPLVVEFRIAAPVAHAFDTWVARAALWWPRGHTVTGAPAAVVFEPRVGGRVFERGAVGHEHVWGEVLAWDAPSHVRYLWHLFFPRAEATVVDVTFTPADGGTEVRLVQTGWDALGDQGPVRRERTVTGWSVVTSAYRAHIDAADPTRPSHRGDQP